MIPNQNRDEEVRAAVYFSVAFLCAMLGMIAVRRTGRHVS